MWFEAMPGCAWKKTSFIAAFAACMAVASVASAQDAAAVYDRGAAAYDRGDFATAAADFARADELAPNPVTLELALGAAVRADDAALGMTLVERVERRRGGKKLEAAATSARRKFSARVGKLNVACPSRCDVAVDGAVIEAGAARFLTVGAHKVVVTRAGASEPFDVAIEPGKTVELVPSSQGPAPSPPPAKIVPPEPRTTPEPKPDPPPKAAERGPSPAWFWVGLGTTIVLGGASALSGLDTKSKYDTFQQDRSNREAADAGAAADLRTTVLLIGTGVVAAATLALGLFVVDWKGDRKSTGARAVSLTVGGGPSDARLGVRAAW